MNIGLLFRPPARPPRPPETLPIGRAALALADRGVGVVFGGEAEHGRIVGLRARPGGWDPVCMRVHAALDRYGSFTHPTAYHRLLAGLGTTPVHNPPALTALLRDKVRTQVLLHDLGMPPLEVDPRRFARGFAKPRFGSFGRGVTLGTPGARATVDGVDQPMIVQRAVPPPPPWTGVSLRILVQRGPDGPIVRTPVARVSHTDVVVNRARGAEVFPADDILPAAAASARELANTVFARVQQRFPGTVELGVDAVVDPDQRPVLIEVNARPRGRLAALAAQDPDRFTDEHRAAVLAPLEAVAR